MLTRIWISNKENHVKNFSFTNWQNCCRNALPRSSNRLVTIWQLEDSCQACKINSIFQYECSKGCFDLAKTYDPWDKNTARYSGEVVTRDRFLHFYNVQFFMRPKVPVDSHSGIAKTSICRYYSFIFFIYEYLVHFKKLISVFFSPFMEITFYCTFCLLLDLFFYLHRSFLEWPRTRRNM